MANNRGRRSSPVHLGLHLPHDLLQGRELIGGHEHTDRAGDTGFTDDQLLLFQQDDHVVNGWRADPEVPFHVCFRRWLAVEFPENPYQRA